MIFGWVTPDKCAPTAKTKYPTLDKRSVEAERLLARTGRVARSEEHAQRFGATALSVRGDLHQG